MNSNAQSSSSNRNAILIALALILTIGGAAVFLSKKRSRPDAGPSVTKTYNFGK